MDGDEHLQFIDGVFLFEGQSYTPGFTYATGLAYLDDDEPSSIESISIRACPFSKLSSPRRLPLPAGRRVMLQSKNFWLRGHWACGSVTRVLLLKQNSCRSCGHSLTAPPLCNCS